jgi:hypothetical protein
MPSHHASRARVSRTGPAEPLTFIAHLALDPGFSLVDVDQQQAFSVERSFERTVRLTLAVGAARVQSADERRRARHCGEMSLDQSPEKAHRLYLQKLTVRAWHRTLNNTRPEDQASHEFRLIQKRP